MPFEKNQNSFHGSQIGYQNRMIQAILNVHVAPIPQTKFRFNLTWGWEKMVFEGYQDGYNGSHIIYIFVFHWNRYSIYECPWCPRLIQVHYISTFNPRRFPIFPYYGFQRLISCRERSQIWRQRLQNVVDGD